MEVFDIKSTDREQHIAIRERNLCICLRWTNIGQAERNILKRAEKGLIC